MTSGRPGVPHLFLTGGNRSRYGVRDMEFREGPVRSKRVYPERTFDSLGSGRVHLEVNPNVWEGSRLWSREVSTVPISGSVTLLSGPVSRPRTWRPSGVCPYRTTRVVHSSRLNYVDVGGVGGVYVRREPLRFPNQASGSRLPF